LETNEDVGRIQEILSELGYDIGKSGVDKVFGNDTRDALAEFIRLGKIRQNGRVGEKTLFALTEHTVNIAGFVPLSWEKFHEERQQWSSYVFKTVEKLFDTSFSVCEDITRFRSDYDSLSRQQKINVWGELICAICKFESGWKPTSWMKENMGTDPVTGQQVRSEGLMQLSYQDKPNYPNLPCSFDWNADKDLNENDPTKTIFNPEINLEFGINILAEQIRKHKRIALSSHVYWAVIKDGGKYQRINEIIRIVENLQL
jgi:hypothetical protein